MITGDKLEALSMDNILKRVSPYDIYRYYLGQDFVPNDTISSPMPGRRDSTPSFIIGDKYGELTYFDFGDSTYRGDCFNFVMQLHGISSLNEAMALIDKDMGLGIKSNGSRTYREIVKEYQRPKINRVKKPSLIQIKTRKFTKEELSWWNGFYQDYEDLKREHIYSIEQAWLNRQRIGLDVLRFAYVYGEKVKIYQPYNDRQKWLSNVPIDVMDGLENIKGCDNALIVKSKKDKMVCRKIIDCVCSVQNESTVAINDQNLEYLRQNSKQQWIGFDSDEPGKKASWYYTQMFGMKHINTPDDLLPNIKDFAGMAHDFGLQAVEKLFKEKHLI